MVTSSYRVNASFSLSVDDMEAVRAVARDHLFDITAAGILAGGTVFGDTEALLTHDEACLRFAVTRMILAGGSIAPGLRIELVTEVHDITQTD